MKTNTLIRILFSVSLISVGALMIFLHPESAFGKLIHEIGFAFIVAGTLSTFHEAVLKKYEDYDSADLVAGNILGKLEMSGHAATGIKLVSAIRKGWDGYYQWTINSRPENLFFAGRSVLHRIDADLRARRIGDAETQLTKRLSEGANIIILLIDPRSDLIPRLAREEGQSDKKLLSDVAISLGICHRLFKLLESKKLPANARLSICVFNEIPYFSYHAVGESMIIGFYFSSTLGHQSAAYEVVDPKTKEFFAEHFKSIFGRANSNYIIRINPNSNLPEFNDDLFGELKSSIGLTLGEAETERLFKSNAH